MTLGQKIKEQMKKQGIKAVNLSKATGLSASRLSNYIHDSREPSLKDLETIARALGVDLNYFASAPFDVK